MDIQKQLQSAKDLSKNGQRQEAKQLLLKLHNTNSSNLQILRGLGRVCQYLQQHDEALGFYQTYLTIHEKDPQIYRRMGDIYQHYNQLQQAQTMYDKALSLSPYDAIYMLLQAKLMEKLENYNQARELYKNAISQNSGSSEAYYCYGKFLLNISNDAHSAQSLLQNAVSLSPNNNAYKYEYDQCLKLLHDEEQSKLNEYLFNPKQNRLINVIIYNFEDLIVFLCDRISMIESDNISNKEINQMFGGCDRINRLCQHFQILMDHNPRITLALFTPLHPNLVLNLLSKTDLSMFFFDAESIFSDRFEEIQSRFCDLQRENILYIDIDKAVTCSAGEFCQVFIIPSITKLPGLKLMDLEHIEHIFQYNTRQTHIFYDNYPFDRPQSMMNENENVYNAIKTEIDTNRGYKNGNYLCVEQLTVFRHICDDPDKCFAKFGDCFKDFAWKYGDVCTAMRRSEFWIAANILTQLINMEENDDELHAKYAKCLSYLKLGKDACYEYEYALKLRNDSYSTHESYAFHLEYGKNHQAAMAHFEFCIDHCRKNNKKLTNANFLSAYSRAADFANEPLIAEEYYKLTLQNDNKRSMFRTAKFCAFYGRFLSQNSRWKEAKIQYENAIKLQPNNAYNHHRLANVLFKMEKFDEHVVPLKQALKINPNFTAALRDFERFFNADYDGDNIGNVGDERKEEIVENININQQQSSSSQSQSATSTNLSKFHPKNKYQNEFNRLFWNAFGAENEVVRKRFKEYFIKMTLKELNDIRVILKHDIKELRKQIKIQIKNIQTGDLEKILTFFADIREKNAVFGHWLDANGIDVFMKQVFEAHCIFTVDGLHAIKNKPDLINIISDASNGDRALPSDVSKELINDLWAMIRSINNNRN